MNFSGFNRLATEISSSISSQWIPISPPINSHSLLCFSVALKSRGNHTSGTDTVRPSSSTTVKASLEHETSTAIASLLTTEVCIPSLQEKISILFNQFTNNRQLVASKTPVGRSCGFTGSSTSARGGASSTGLGRRQNRFTFSREPHESVVWTSISAAGRSPAASQGQ